jgi:hypothetical protein
MRWKSPPQAGASEGRRLCDLVWLFIGTCVAAAPMTAAQREATQTTTPATAQTTTATAGGFTDRAGSHWLASGFAGSNFAEDAEEVSVDFGGTVGYLWRGVFGGEFHANFSPEFELGGTRSALLFDDQPAINSYMANAVGAVPLGDEGRWRPYVSGGLGILTLRSETLGATNDDIEPDDSRFGGNIGGGLLAFIGKVGLRGDVRFFRGLNTGDDIDPVENQTEAIGNQVLSELKFWRASGGVAFRW